MNVHREAIPALIVLALLAFFACETETGPELDTVSVEPVSPVSLDEEDRATVANFSERDFSEEGHKVPESIEEVQEMLSSLAGGNGTSGSVFSLRQSNNGESPDSWLEDNDDFDFSETQGEDFYEFSLVGESEDDQKLKELDGFTGGNADFFLDLDIFFREEFPSSTELDAEGRNGVYGRIDIDDAAGDGFDDLAGRIAAAANVNFAESMRFDGDSFELTHASTAYSISSEFSVALSIESGAGDGHFLLSIEYDHDFAVSASSFQEYSTALQEAFGEGEYTIGLAVYADPDEAPVFADEFTIDDFEDFGQQMTSAIVGSRSESIRARR